jgi:xylulokinase
VKDLLLGIDLGSTSLKAIIYDTQGNVVARAQRATKKCHPEPEHPEWVTWAPEQIWGDSAAACREAIEKLDDPSAIRAVAVTGMGMDGVPMDESGNWLYPFISWHDPRTGPQFEWWQKNITAEKVFSIGGNPLWPINSALRILWIKENEPGIYRKTYKWLLIEDFLNHKLCGRFATDYSMASCTLLFDQRERDWSQVLLDDAGIPREMMPEPHPSGTPLGEVHAEASKMTGIPEGTPVILGGHDHLCSALPVGAFKAGSVLNITGSWETVITVSDDPALNPLLFRSGITVQSHVARGLYGVWGGNPAGEMVEWFRRQLAVPLGCEDGEDPGFDWQQLVHIGQKSPPGADGVLFLPHLSASACPIVDPKSFGAFVGLSTRTTRGDMFRAVIEGLDYQFLDIVGAMQKGLGFEAKEFIAVGGATRNRFWMQNKADMVGRPIVVPEVEEATPLGAAILAGIGTELFADEQDAFDRVAKKSETFEPDEKNHSFYRERFEFYSQLYPALAPIHHRLFG